jgi:O-antigen/teichoic acid export membrane protein
MSQANDPLPPGTARGGGESVTRGTVLLTLSNAVGRAASAAIHVLAARALLEADYGRFVTTLLVLSWLSSLIHAIILPGLRKIVSEDERRYRAALSFALRWYSVAVAVIAAAFLLTPELLARAFGDEGLAPLFRIGGVQVPFMGLLALATVLLLALRRFARASLAGASVSVCRALAAAVLLAAGLGVRGVVAAFVAGIVITAPLPIAFLLAERRRRAALAYAPMARRTLRWTLAGLPTVVGLRTAALMHVWLVKALMADPAAAGAYGAAYSLSHMPSFVVGGLLSAAFPRISHAMHHGDTAAARSVSLQAFRFVLILLTPVCFLLAAAPAEALSLVFSARYAGGAEALAVVVWGVLLSGLMGCALRMVAAADRPVWVAAAAAGLAAVAAGTGALLIPRFHLPGAAWGFVVTFGVGAGVSLAMVRRRLGIVLPWRTAGRCGVAGAAVFALSLAWPAAGWVVAVKLAALGGAYLAILFGLRELRPAELRRIWRRVFGAAE